jgi:adenylate kinase family enzyme
MYMDKAKKRTMLQGAKAARIAGVPLVTVACYDPLATARHLASSFVKLGEGVDDLVTCAVVYDALRGTQALSFELTPEEQAAGKERPVYDRTSEVLAKMNLVGAVNPIDLLSELSDTKPSKPHFPLNTCVFLVNGHHLMDPNNKDAPETVAALYAARDVLKARGSTLFVLGYSHTLPPELQNDFLMLDEELPDDTLLAKITRAIYGAAKEDWDSLPSLTDEDVTKAVDAVRGLPRFAAEQTVALAIKQRGLDFAELWARKLQQITSTEGLSAWMGGQRFDDLGGLDYIKTRFRRIIKGKRPIRVVVWIDEGEKDTGGAGHETSGTSMDQLKVLLTEMVDRDYTGAILLGVPGSGKSAFAKALANEAEVLCIRLDLGALRGHGLVGQAEQTIRNAMKTVNAVGGDGGAFFVMTTNDINSLKPEFKARFHKGVWFFDTPTPEGQETIWRIYLRKYGFVEDAARPATPDWVGREIEECVRTAHDEDMPLHEAIATIIPVSVSDRNGIEALRREADAKYLNPERPGAYRAPGAEAVDEGPARRKVGVQED